MSVEGQQIMVRKYLEIPLEDHPIASAFPLLPEEELRELSKDIEQKGLMNPIVIHQDKILDGRNRYRAIKLMPSWSGKLELYWLILYFGPDPYEYVVSMNCRRRHLTTSQRAFIAADLVNMPNHRPSNNPANLPTYVSQADVAKLFSISERSIRTAKAIKEANLELFESGKRGEISLNAAYQQVKPDSELDQDANLHLDSHERTDRSANSLNGEVNRTETNQSEPPKSWTAPEMGEDRPEQVTKETASIGAVSNPHLNMTLIEAMTTAIEMVGDSENLNRGELRSVLARARALIDQKLEDL